MKKITMMLAVAVIFIVSAKGQSFLNLNFESAYNLPGAGSPTNNEPVSVTNALPDWTAYAGPNDLADIYYVSNNFPGSSSLVELEGGSLALDGSFSVGLYSGGSISQTGLVPANAESLQFEASSPVNLYVTLGGQSLSYSVLSEDSGYDVYGVNIPADLDGQTEALTFGLQGFGQTLLDDIEFSPETIPEPGEFGLVGLGVVLWGIFQLQKRKAESGN